MIRPLMPLKDFARASAKRSLDVLASRLASRDALASGSFSVADAYLFWALTVLPFAGVPTDGFASLRRYYGLHRERAAVRDALAFEKAQYDKPFAVA